MKTKRLAWSCDERDRNACRNSHGCHCAEIAALQERLRRETDRANGFLLAAQVLAVPTSHLERAQMIGRRRRGIRQ